MYRFDGGNERAARIEPSSNLLGTRLCSNYSTMDAALFRKVLCKRLAVQHSKFVYTAIASLYSSRISGCYYKPINYTS